MIVDSLTCGRTTQTCSSLLFSEVLLEANAPSLIHRVSMTTDPEERPPALAFRLIRPPLSFD